MDSLSSISPTSYGPQAQTYGQGEARIPQTTSGDTTDTEQASLADSSASKTIKNGNKLSTREDAAVQALQKRDQEVRQHEAAHLAAAGGLAISGANFSLQYGPDGKAYAVGGEVRIDISPGRTPEETIRKARIIQAAALAPSNPSAQDRQIATQAQAMETEAQAEIAQRSFQALRVAKSYQSDSLPHSTLATAA